MNITQETDYAIRAVVSLAEVGENTRLDAKYISEKCSIPLRFLLKLLRKLTNKKIINSFRGVNGGYSLGKSPFDITFKDIVEAIEGPIVINKCIASVDNCNANKNGDCLVHDEFYKIQKILEEALNKVTIGDVINK